MIKKFVSEKKSSDTLPELFDSILKEYAITGLYYAKGPGSFMSIKVSYIFLRTLSITKNIPLYATEGFIFNGNNPIKATGALYFMKKDGKISTKKISPQTKCDFTLPKVLKQSDFSDEVEPLYVLPAV